MTAMPCVPFDGEFRWVNGPCGTIGSPRTRLERWRPATRFRRGKWVLAGHSYAPGHDYAWAGRKIIEKMTDQRVAAAQGDTYIPAHRCS